MNGVKPMIVDFGMSRLGSKPAGRPTKIIGSKAYASLRVLDLQYPVPADDVESLGLVMLFPRSRWTDLAERETEITELTCTVETSFFAVLRDGKGAIDYSALKQKLEALIKKRQLGLKM